MFWTGLNIPKENLELKNWVELLNDNGPTDLIDGIDLEKCIYENMEKTDISREL